jgi:hypothetical protein
MRRTVLKAMLDRPAVLRVDPWGVPWAASGADPPAEAREWEVKVKVKVMDMATAVNCKLEG